MCSELLSCSGLRDTGVDRMEATSPGRGGLFPAKIVFPSTEGKKEEREKKQKRKQKVKERMRARYGLIDLGWG